MMADQESLFPLLDGPFNLGKKVRERAQERGLLKLLTPADETDDHLADLGRAYLTNTRSEESIQEWDEPVVEVQLSDEELEALALAMGHHREVMKGEGRGAFEGGFKERAGGLFAAIDRVNKLLQRIRHAKNGDGTLQLNQWDYVNLLGLPQYDANSAEHHKDWVTDLNAQNPDLVAGAGLLEGFTTDFQRLDATLDDVTRKLRTATPVPEEQDEGESPDPEKEVY